MTNPSSLALHTALQWMVRHPTEAGDPRSFEKSDHRGTIAALRGTEKHMRNAVPMAQLLSIAQNERPWALTRTKGYIENSHRLHKKRQREHYKQKREWERQERGQDVQQWKRRWKSSQTSSPLKKSGGTAWTFWPKPSSPHEQQKRQRERREEQDRHKQQWVAKQKLSSQTKGIFGTTSFSPSVSPQTVSRPRPVLPVLPSSQLTKNVTRHMWQRIDQKK